MSSLILVGQVAGAFGVKGEVRVTAFTADPGALLDYGALMDESGKPALILTAGRVEQNAVVAATLPALTREGAQALRGLRLYIERDRLPPTEEEDEFYLVDLIGLAVFSPTGETLGRVKFVANFGAGDLLEIAPATPGEASWYAPFTRAVVPVVDIASGRVVVDRPPEIESQPEPYPRQNEAEP